MVNRCTVAGTEHDKHEARALASLPVACKGVSDRQRHVAVMRAFNSFSGIALKSMTFRLGSGRGVMRYPAAS